MKAFVDLFEELDSTTSTKEKIGALKKYFALQDATDSMWAILLLTGKISRRTMTGRRLRNLFLSATQYPEWLLEECHADVGDTAETLSLLAQNLHLTSKTVRTDQDASLTEWMEEKIPSVARIEDEKEQARVLLEWWKDLTAAEVFIVNKLITGAFRVGVSEKLVIRALSELHEIPTDQIAHRLIGAISPSAEEFATLTSKEISVPSFSQPYPFCLAHAWSERRGEGWKAEDWCIEWKYDGIRAQVIAREGRVWIWSRGEEDITKAFPDLELRFRALPDGTVIDGEIVVMQSGQVQSFNDLQSRLGRKKVSAPLLKQKPAGFIAYDCLEANGQDIRQMPLTKRKDVLSILVSPLLGQPIQLSPVLRARSIEDLEKLRQQAREENAEGVMIKSWASPYSVGRKTGNWWKFKVDPFTLDAVLLYAQAGSGRRANLYTDYTFALWNEEKKLVSFAKAYSGLNQQEIDELDRWIRTHTKEKFGPVRSVEPAQVFEIGFEGIARSSRHKSGIAVRFPRILRWRKDKKVEEADHLVTAESLL